METNCLQIYISNLRILTNTCHVYHSKKSIPYTQALRFNRICSENKFFDKICNQLECWLKDRGYNEKVVRQQILKATKFTRKHLLNQDSKQTCI